MNSGLIWCKGFFFMRLISSSLIATVNTFVTRVWVGGVAFLVVDSRRWCGPQMIGNLFSIQVDFTVGGWGALYRNTLLLSSRHPPSYILNRSSFFLSIFFPERSRAKSLPREIVHVHVYAINSSTFPSSLPSVDTRCKFGKKGTGQRKRLAADWLEICQTRLRFLILDY